MATITKRSGLNGNAQFSCRNALCKGRGDEAGNHPLGLSMNWRSEVVIIYSGEESID